MTHHKHAQMTSECQITHMGSHAFITGARIELYMYKDNCCKNPLEVMYAKEGLLHMYQLSSMKTCVLRFG